MMTQHKKSSVREAKSPDEEEHRRQREAEYLRGGITESSQLTKDVSDLFKRVETKGEKIRREMFHV
jgi:hypothetical protein